MESTWASHEKGKEKLFEERKKNTVNEGEQKKSVLRINVSRYYYYFYCMHSPARLIKFEVAHNANTQTMAIANLFNCKLKMRGIAKIHSTVERGVREGAANKMENRNARFNDNWFDYCLINKNWVKITKFSSKRIKFSRWWAQLTRLARGLLVSIKMDFKLRALR